MEANGHDRNRSLRTAANRISSGAKSENQSETERNEEPGAAEEKHTTRCVMTVVWSLIAGFLCNSPTERTFTPLFGESEIQRADTCWEIKFNTCSFTSHQPLLLPCDYLQLRQPRSRQARLRPPCFSSQILIYSSNHWNKFIYKHVLCRMS